MSPEGFIGCRPPEPKNYRYKRGCASHGLDAHEKEQILKLWRENLAYFMEDTLTAWTGKGIPEFHRQMAKEINDQKYYFCEAPRGFAKSYLCSRFKALHDALLWKNSDICIISASEGLAIEHLRWIKVELESNGILKTFFGDQTGKEKWSETHIMLKNGSQIRARGAEAQIRGFRPTCIILDDIEDEETVNSEDRRNKLRNWILKSCLPALTPEGQFVMIGTPISPLAIIEEFINRPMSEWTRRKYAAYKSDDEKEGNELWKEHWDHAKLQERKKAIGSWAFSCEYMCNPKFIEGAPIQQEHIKTWKYRPENLSMVLVIDPAYSESDNADYKVAYLAGIDHLHNRYCIKYIRTHAPSGEFIDAALSIYQCFKRDIVAFGIPCGREREFYDKVIEKAEQRQIYAPFVELENMFRSVGGNIRNKQRRIIASLQPLFEAGKYYISADMHELKEELLTIGSSKHDDLVDCACYAEQLLVKATPPSANDTTTGRYGELMEEEMQGIGLRYDYGY